MVDAQVELGVVNKMASMDQSTHIFVQSFW